MSRSAATGAGSCAAVVRRSSSRASNSSPPARVHSMRNEQPLGDSVSPCATRCRHSRTAVENPIRPPRGLQRATADGSILFPAGAVVEPWYGADLPTCVPSPAIRSPCCHVHTRYLSTHVFVQISSIIDRFRHHTRSYLCSPAFRSCPTFLACPTLQPAPEAPQPHSVKVPDLGTCVPSETPSHSPRRILRQIIRSVPRSADTERFASHSSSLNITSPPRNLSLLRIGICEATSGQ